MKTGLFRCRTNRLKSIQSGGVGEETYLGHMHNAFAIRKGAFAVAQLLELRGKAISTWLNMT
jgi:hypothetical protein